MTKFIVTDPCYILPHKIWNTCCEVFRNKNNDSDDLIYEKFDKVVQEELRKFSGTDKAWAGSTGIGDWSNTLNSVSNEIKIIEGDFVADSGMVCCTELTSSVKKSLIDNYGKLIGALFEVSDSSDITCEIDKSDKTWTIIRIYASNTLVAISDEYYYREYDYDTGYDDENEEENC